MTRRARPESTTSRSIPYFRLKYLVASIKGTQVFKMVKGIGPAPNLVPARQPQHSLRSIPFFQPHILSTPKVPEAVILPLLCIWTSFRDIRPSSDLFSFYFTCFHTASSSGRSSSLTQLVTSQNLATFVSRRLCTLPLLYWSTLPLRLYAFHLKTFRCCHRRP